MTKEIRTQMKNDKEIKKNNKEKETTKTRERTINRTTSKNKNQKNLKDIATTAWAFMSAGRSDLS